MGVRHEQEWHPHLVDRYDGRAVLSIGALVDAYKNPVLRPYDQRLLAAGKPKKLALTACMRKFLVILNAMVKAGTHWDVTTALAHA